MVRADSLGSGGQLPGSKNEKARRKRAKEPAGEWTGRRARRAAVRESEHGVPKRGRPGMRKEAIPTRPWPQAGKKQGYRGPEGKSEEGEEDEMGRTMAAEAEGKKGTSASMAA